MSARYRSLVIFIMLVVAIVVTSRRLGADSGTCGGATTTLPFTDVGSSIFFCQIAEAYLSGLTNGTSPTTYSPTGPVTREQMAAFMVRTQDSALRRGSKRAALNQWATPGVLPAIATTPIVGHGVGFVASDGTDVWVTAGDGAVDRVRASDGRVIETWTSAEGASGVLAAWGRIYIVGLTNPGGSLYMIDPSQPAGPVTVLSTSLGSQPITLTTDGSFIWTGNFAGGVSRINIDGTSPVTFSPGISPMGILFDGTNVWVTDRGDNRLKRLDSNGNVLQAVTVGGSPHFPIFDGTNIWVPNALDDTVTVVRASTGAVVATLSGNGLNQPISAAFDGQRVLITNSSGHSVSLWRAADLQPMVSVPMIASGIPYAVASDGLNFWITLEGADKVARF